MKPNHNIQLASKDSCIGCAACYSVCPTNSIIMHENNEGFLQPIIDAGTCIGCHKCERTCPVLKPINILANYDTQAYVAINKDDDVRIHSSSGGVFYAIAKSVIMQGG